MPLKPTCIPDDLDYIISKSKAMYNDGARLSLWFVSERLYALSSQSSHFTSVGEAHGAHWQTA